MKKEKELKIEYVPIGEIQPYAKNAKLHPDYQIEQIKKSIQKFGMNDPIAVWKNEIVEGHGRLIACTELGIETIPIIRLDDLTDKQRKAYALAHNKLTMNSGFDFALLSEELKGLEEFDMGEFGFGDFEIENFDEDFEPEPYDEEVMEEYGEADTTSFNVTISCVNEDQQEWLRNLLHEEKRLQKLYDCSTIMERFPGGK